MKRKILSLLLIFAVAFSLIAPIKTQAANIKLNKTKLNMEVNATFKLTLGKVKSTNVSWWSSDKTIASVSKWGTITAKSDGQTTIIAKYKNKKYKCIINVNNYSDWVEYSTDNFNNLIDNIMKGTVIYINGEYYCSPEYFKMLTNAEIEYEKDISSESTKKTQALDPEAEYVFVDDTDKKNADDAAASKERRSNIMKYGFSSSEDLETELGRAYINFCTNWISEYELEYTYGISVVWDWPDHEVYFISGLENKYIIENAPDKFISGEILTDKDIQYLYLENFEYNGNGFTVNEFYFNRQDLINKSIIK